MTTASVHDNAISETAVNLIRSPTIKSGYKSVACGPNQVQVETTDVPASDTKAVNELSACRHLYGGAPKTSRFMKSLDTSSNAQLNAHTYNPYLYTQHKTRPNAPFYVLHVKSKQLIDSQNIEGPKVGSINGYEYTIKAGSVPTFKIKKSVIPSPSAFYETVKDIGEEFGAIILNIEDDISASEKDSDLSSVSSTLNEFSLDTEYFWFKARKQYLNSFKSENKKKLDFHRRLFKFYKEFAAEADTAAKPKVIGKVPSIDKRTLDLYRLRNCVLLRGGFKAVCEKKLWAQLGRELGYSGRIMSSLSTSLRSAYAKVFSDYDKWEEDQSNNKFDEQPSSVNLDGTNFAADSMENNGESNKKRTFEDSKDEMPTEDMQQEKKSRLAKVKAYHVGSSCAEYTRIRDIKACKGIETNFERVTEGFLNLTEPKASLPNYNFSFWQSGMEIYDKSSHENMNSPIYNLRQYYEKSLRHLEVVESMYKNISSKVFLEDDKIEQMAFEKMFFDILADPNLSFDVDTGIDLPSIVHGSGFRTISKSNNNIKDILDPWNFNNIPLSKDSLFQFLDIDYGNLTRPKLNVGMLFSTKGWSIGDQFLPEINYNYLGSSLLWYIVPPESQEAFEKLVLEINSILNTPNDDQENIEPDLRRSEVFKSYAETNPSSPVTTISRRSRAHEAYTTKDKKSTSASYLLPNDLQLHPDDLAARGIKVYKACQNANSFILFFPRSYHTSISTGFHVSESCYLAPQSWLKNLEPSKRWFSERQMLQSVNSFEFLKNIVENSNEERLVKEAKELLIPMINEELKLREVFVGMFPEIYLISNDFDFISDEDLSFTFPSKVVIVADAGEQFTMSLSSFLSQIKKNDNTYMLFSKEISYSNLHCHVYYSTEALQCLLNDITAEGKSEKHPVEKVADLVLKRYSGSRIPLSILESLLRRHQTTTDPQLLEVKQYIEHIQPMILQCRGFLERMNISNIVSVDYGSGFNLNELPALRFNCTADELETLCKELRPLSVEFVELNSVFQTLRRFKEFQEISVSALSAKDLNQMKLAYGYGAELGIKSNYLDSLATSIIQIGWLDTYDLAIVHRSPSCYENYEDYNLRSMYNFLKIGVRYLDHNVHQEKLERLSNILKRSQEIIDIINGFFKKKNYKVPIQQLEFIMDSLNNEFIPLEPEVVSSLWKLAEGVREVKHKFIPSCSRLSVNENASKLATYLKTLDNDALKYIPYFNGSEQDLRMSAGDISMEEYPAFFGRYLKESKTWTQTLGKLIPNWRTSLDSILDHTRRCLDIAHDVFYTSEMAHNQSVYCFCRNGDIGSTMVECEICREWYHISCINDGNWSLPPDDKSAFLCTVCSPIPIEQKTKKLDIHHLLELLHSSVTLKIIPDRLVLHKLFAIFECVLKFRGKLQSECEDLSSAEFHEKAKFYLRKLQGAGCQMTAEITQLQNTIKNDDLNAIAKLRASNRTIVTGYEALLNSPKDNNDVKQSDATDCSLLKHNSMISSHNPESPTTSFNDSVISVSTGISDKLTQINTHNNPISSMEPVSDGKDDTSNMGKVIPKRIGIADLLSPLPEN
ncbi:HER117Wp [Eremothecium sinecaudum]|uniref:HER117Wp n=1 Tax=Eremothecium sinecaudum TaxID=45286 RepID=A0A0X8HTY7_9SACH|nr:HER117Wp [Eremothecium sinecaudum]AMD21396.1 HER117Wp [Eremothecium sinecaudum]